MKRPRELGPRFAVDQRVMHLGVEREATRRHARHVVEPLDHVRLPKRLAAIERPGVQARDLDAELAPVAGLRQRDVSHVELDIEVRVLDPPRAVEHPRHGDEPAPEMRNVLDARREEPQDVLEADLAARGGGGVVDPEPGDVHVVVAAFELQERVVEPGKLSHVGSSAACRHAPMRSSPVIRRPAPSAAYVLLMKIRTEVSASAAAEFASAPACSPRRPAAAARATTDRKSTRLNSSHSQISYAVFCLKKK